MNFDELMMTRCLELAAAGAGRVSPNPMVGAVLVYEGRVIGEGYHQQYGGAHAEVHAVESVCDDDKKFIPASTLYVNLEPCNHHGKTPPCTDMIIRNKIKKVVVGCVDPNSEAAGGMEKLKEHGVEVINNVLHDACAYQNRFFFTYHQKQRPYIILKWAQSADGFIAKENGAPQHFTNTFSDQLVHQWRATCDAILVGGRTVLNDNPQLTTRFWPGKNPLRIVIDMQSNLDKSLQVFNTAADTIIFNFTKNAMEGNLHYIQLDAGQPLVPAMMQHLWKLNISSLIVEGGARTISLFVDAGLWDGAKVFISPLVMDSGILAPSLPGAIHHSENIFDQILLTTYPA